MRRIGVVVALGALMSMIAGAATAAPALAVGGRGDGWVYQDFGPGFTTDNCGFHIVATQDVDNVFAKALTAPDGSMIMLFTGAAKLTYTNPANEKSVSANTSAAGKIVVSPDGTTTTFRSMGLTPIDLTPDDAARLGVPAVFVFAGNGTATLDAAGNIISGSMNGHILVNVCAVLSQEIPGAVPQQKPDVVRAANDVRGYVSPPAATAALLGGLVPAYTLTGSVSDIAVQRILVRLGVSRDLASLLLDDFRDAVAHFTRHPVTVSMTKQESGGFSHL